AELIVGRSLMRCFQTIVGGIWIEVRQRFCLESRSDGASRGMTSRAAKRTKQRFTPPGLFRIHDQTLFVEWQHGRSQVGKNRRGNLLLGETRPLVGYLQTISTIVVEISKLDLVFARFERKAP